jgi:hypothetical protein
MSHLDDVHLRKNIADVKAILEAAGWPGSSQDRQHHSPSTEIRCLQIHEAEGKKSTTLSKTPRSWHPLLNACDTSRRCGAHLRGHEDQGTRTRRTSKTKLEVLASST